MRAERGFTLTEVLVGLGISAIVAAIAVPSTATYLYNYQLSSVANTVAFEIGRARTQAVSQNRAVRMNIEGRLVCRQAAPSVTGPWDPVSCSDAPDVIELPRSTAAEVTGQVPVFDRNGTASAVSTIRLSNPAGEMVIDTNLLGRVDISRVSAS